MIAMSSYEDGGEWSVSFNPDGRACIKNLSRNRYLQASQDGKDFALALSCDYYTKYFHVNQVTN